MFNAVEANKKLVVDENRALDKYVQLSKEYDDIITVAAAHIEDAKRGRGQHGKSYAMGSSWSVRLAYNIIFSPVWHYFIIIVITVNCSLLFILDNNPTYLSLEVVCLFWYVVDIILLIIFYTPKQFFKPVLKTALKSKLQFLLTLLFIIDFGVTAYHFYWSDKQLVEIVIPFQFLRPVLFIIKITTVSHIFMVVVQTFTRIVKTLLAIILFIGFFSCIAVHIFGEIYHQQQEDDVYFGQFDNIGTAFIRLFVLLTTENYPDIMQPAFSYQETTILYFVIFIYLGVFILLSILLAIVVDNYWTIAKMNVKKVRLRGRKQLAAAWNLLADGEEKLSVYDENLLGVFRKLKPKNDDEEIVVLLQQLTTNINRSIIEYKSWLTRVTDILDLEIERTSLEDSNFMSGLVKKSGGKCMIYLTLTIQSAVIQRLVLILLYIHTLLFAVFRYDAPHMERIVQWCRVVLSAVFFVEVFLRVSVLAYLNWEESGKYGTFSNRFLRWVRKVSRVDVLDVFLVVLGSLANAMWFYVATFDDKVEVQNSEFITPYIGKGLCVVISSIAYIMRLLVNSAQAKKGYILLKMIIPVMFDLTALLLISVFGLASLGETVFTPSIHDQGPTSVQDASSNCTYGFETFQCSLVTMFQVATTSNWHEILQKLEETQLSFGAAIYFIVIYIILHMVIINLFVAISYEAYNKFVSKPKQTRKKEEKVGLKKKLGKFLAKYTAGNRKRVSSSPRPIRRESVTIKRKSLNKIHEKISDSSLGENAVIPPDNENRNIGEDRAAMSSLPPEKRHEMILKQRMQKKAEAKGRVRRTRPANSTAKPTGFADVVRQYTAKAEDELSLSPGQKVKVLEREGTKCRGLVMDGPNAGKHGWFPAFVIGTFVSEMNKAAQEKKPLPKTDSQPKFVKKQNADWTKDIIGPMTIMNPEELRELNKILKANARGARSSTDSHRGSTDSTGSSPTNTKPGASSRTSFRNPMPSTPTITKIVEEEEDEDVDDNVFTEINKVYTNPMKLPEVIIEQPSIILEEEEEEEADVQHLQSPKIATPETKAKEKWKKKLENKKGDMPDWAKKFMVQSNAKVADSSSIRSPTESDTSDPLSKSSTPDYPSLDKKQTTPGIPTNNSNLPKIKLPSSNDLVIENKFTIIDIPDSPIQKVLPLSHKPEQKTLSPERVQANLPGSCEPVQASLPSPCETDHITVGKEGSIVSHSGVETQIDVKIEDFDN